MWIAVSKTEKFAGPRWSNLRNVVPPKIIFARFFNRVIFASDMIHRETNGERLLVLWRGFFRRMQFAGVFLRFRAGDKFGFGERQQISQFGGVDEIRRLQEG